MMTIDVRSASRVGDFDLCVNRRRMEEIRPRFNAVMQERIQGDEDAKNLDFAVAVQLSAVCGGLRPKGAGRR